MGSEATKGGDGWAGGDAGDEGAHGRVSEQDVAGGGCRDGAVRATGLSENRQHVPGQDAAAPDRDATAGEEPAGEEPAGEEPAGAAPPAGKPAEGARAASPETAPLPRPGSGGPDGACSPSYMRHREESTDLSEADTLQSDADDSTFVRTAASISAARTGRGPSREATHVQCNRGTCAVIGRCICGDPSPVRKPRNDSHALLRADRSRVKLDSEWSNSV